MKSTVHLARPPLPATHILINPLHISHFQWVQGIPNLSKQKYFTHQLEHRKQTCHCNIIFVNILTLSSCLTSRKL